MPFIVPPHEEQAERRRVTLPDEMARSNGQLRHDPPTLTPDGPAAIFTHPAEVESRPVPWIWKGVLARSMLTTIAGEGGGGKSTLLLDLLVRMANGLAMPDGSTPDLRFGGRSLMLSPEDDASFSLRPKIDAAGGDPDRRIVLYEGTRREERDGDRLAVWTDPPRVPEDLAKVSRYIERVGGVDVVLIDPIDAMTAGANANDAHVVRPLLARLDSFAKHHECAVIIVRHFSKAMADKARAKVGGSTQWIDGVRAAFLVLDDEDGDRSNGEPRFFTCCKMNHARPPKSTRFTLVDQGMAAGVRWGDVDERRADELMAASNRYRAPQRSEAEEVLEELLADGPLPSNEIEEAVEAAGVSMRTAKRAKMRLGIESRRSAFNGVWYWCLPGQEVPDAD